MNRFFLLILVLAVGCGRSQSPQSTPLPTIPKPIERYKDCNLIFVSLDALQASHLGCYGYHLPVSPSLDAFAAKSHRFSQVSSVASWTVPASMSWFTGVYPSEHRMTNKFALYTREMKKPANLKELAPELVTLADLFRSNGYATAGFTGNAGVSAGFGFEQGFDIYDHETNKFGRFDRSIPRALDWITRNKDKKFFLFLHGYDVHGQSTPANGYDYRFVTKNYDGKFVGSELEQEVLREEGLVSGLLTLRDQDVQFWRALYDEKIQRLDYKFQHFLDEVEKLGLMDRTVFVVTSDHGTELYEHRRFDHGFTLYQEQIHVPLMIHTPGQVDGTTCTQRVSSIDLMPTILELMDLDLSAKAQRQLRGTSLLQVMKGEPVKRDLFSETDYRQYTYKRAITTPDGWKLIVTLEKRSKELYDLNSDPSEQFNRVGSQSERADELEKKLYSHFRQLGCDLDGRQWEIGMNPVYSSQGQEVHKK